MPKSLVSYYAPAGRSTLEEIENQKRLLRQYHGPVSRFYDAVTELVLILNRDRQIVYFNSAAAALLGEDNPNHLYGLRPGEALGCSYSCLYSGGCGTSEYCTQCGAVNAILSALNNKADLRECRILKGPRMEALNLLIRTTPLRLEGQNFSILAITDISHEKRRQVLERIFFHDLMNTASAIQLLSNAINSKQQEIRGNPQWATLLAGIKQLIAELKSQKELLAAENGELLVERVPVDANAIIKNLSETFNQRFTDREVVVQCFQEKMVLNTDQGLFTRVLENMVLNALEASPPGQKVIVSSELVDGFAEFRVHNAGFIPKEHQLQLFQRSFTTKDAGRGLGTYSMKLLSEQYLEGSISFKSSLEQGTTFIARYPA